jgi:hypothetical protein
MAPAKKAKEAPKKVYDYSGLEKGMRLQVESDGSYYAADVVQVSDSKNRAKAPVKIRYKGYEGYDEWVGGDRIRSKALKAKAPEKKPAPERKPAAFATGEEIPVKRVARVYRFKVADEKAAMGVDALLNEMHSMLYAERKDKAKGYLKCSRTVCKAEWAYECSAIFNSLENFKAYDDGEWRKEAVVPKLSGLYDLAVGGKDGVYSGVRVYDELGSRP